MLTRPLLLLALACQADPAGPDDTGPLDDGPVVTWEGWADGFFQTWCRACHSAGTPQRNGAPEGVDFDTEEQARAWADRIAVRVLEEGTMPVGGGLFDEDRVLLRAWLDGTAP